MAERRMFAKSITESDAFLEMPLSAQALYFHLSMNADDDGFVGSPKRIVRMISASEDDLKLLLTKRFVLGFNSGIVVIKHWRMNNYIQKDRYKQTVYQEEYKSLQVKSNGAYTELDTQCIQNGYKSDTQYSIGKYSIGKNSIGKYIDEYEKEIGILSPFQYEKLTSYLNDLSEDMIIEAIHRASGMNKKSLAYIEAILKSWISNGYKVVADIEDKPKKKHEETNEERMKRLLGE